VTSFSLSIIVPVWREAALIRPFLAHLREQAPEAEMIVVDGGSDDGTARLCEGSADKILQTSRGRARQMNAGAERATGEVLWFLHADSRLPAGAVELMADCLRDPRLAGGCFRLRFPRPKSIYRISDSLGNVAVDLFGIALGDHGIFCRREAFLAAGPYPDLPLLEDAEFYRALRRVGRVRQLPAEIVTSPRRYEEHGPYRTTAVYLLILALYLAGVPIAFLQKIHNRFVARRRNIQARPDHFHESLHIT
jgi:rSAM/selenodomain-associated transferase 2